MVSSEDLLRKLAKIIETGVMVQAIEPSIVYNDELECEIIENITIRTTLGTFIIYPEQDYLVVEEY
jgi:hypothetical protein